MPRRLICALIAALAPLAGPLRAAPSETLYGMLISISSTDLILDTGEDHPVQAQINSITKYLSTMGKVKVSDFEPGDKVTVEATETDGGRYLSTAITLNKKGSAEDKQTARNALNPPGAKPPAQAPPTGDSAPVLRRGGSTPPAQPPPPAQRPSLTSDDVNGVTHTPAAPPYPSDDIIFQTREVAANFTETLPNYVVKEFTTRYISQAANRGRTPWQAQDVVTVDLIYLDGKENYTNMMINGRASKDASKNGSWSEGEFASSLNALLSPYSATEFRNKRAVTIVNRPAFKYDYTIDQPRSAWRIETGGQVYQPGYDGSIWIDKESFRVLRIEMSARNLPGSFPIDTTESSLDYDFVLIGEQKFLLPVHSESLSCWRENAQCSRNVIDFRNYKKYSADSSITFDSAAPNK
jgi:hypothetical protein